MKRNRLKTVFKLSLVSVLLFGCHNAELDNKMILESVEVSEDFESVSKSNSSVEKPKSNFLDLKIIKSANVRYKVKDVKKATEQIKNISEFYNSYISELRFENNLYKKENRFTIKVPAEYFDTIMDSINLVAEFVDFENITTKDVTAEFIDIQSRLKTKVEVKERYEFILRKKAKNVEDLLKTEEKLQRIQEEIEASQGRLKYITSKVAFSTLNIDLYETVEFKEEPTLYKKTFLSEIKEGFVSGWNILKMVFIGVIYIWPLILIGLAIFFFLRRRLKK